MKCQVIETNSSNQAQPDAHLRIDGLNLQAQTANTQVQSEEAKSAKWHQNEPNVHIGTLCPRLKRHILKRHIPKCHLQIFHHLNEG